jgi:hypothetical protein
MQKIFSQPNIRSEKYLEFVDGSMLVAVDTEEYGHLVVEKDIGSRGGTTYLIRRDRDELLRIYEDGRGQLGKSPFRLDSDAKPTIEEASHFIADVRRLIEDSLPPGLDQMYFRKIR